MPHAALAYGKGRRKNLLPGRFAGNGDCRDSRPSTDTFYGGAFRSLALRDTSRISGSSGPVQETMAESLFVVQKKGNCPAGWSQRGRYKAPVQPVGQAEPAEWIIQRHLDRQPRAAGLAEGEHILGSTCEMGVSIRPYRERLSSTKRDIGTNSTDEYHPRSHP